MLNNNDYIENPLVTCIIPVYGVEHYIEKCARSLFEQSYDNIEYIFVNDCTKDNSIEVLEKVILDYPKRKDAVTIIRHSHNKGLAGVRNTGINAAHGEYLTHVDSDDFLDLNVIEETVRIALDEKADIVTLNMRQLFKTHNIVEKQRAISNTAKEYVKQLLTYKVIFTACGKLYKTSLFENLNTRFIEGINYGEDYVTTPRIAYYANRIAHCETCFYNYVRYNENSYTINYKEKNIDDLLEALNILKNFFESKSDYQYFHDSLLEASLRVKLNLITGICLSTNNVMSRLKEVCSLFNDIEIKKYKISLDHKIALWLARYQFGATLKFYICMGYRIKKFLKFKIR